MKLLATLLVGLVASCGSDGLPEVRPDPPAAPAANDPAYTVTRLRSWYLIGNPATVGHDALEIEVAAPAGTDYVDLWIGDRPGRRLDPYQGHFVGVIDITDLAAGEHEVLVAANGSDTAFARHLVQRTHPLYVLVSTDWDFSDPTDLALNYHLQLRQFHPAIKYTHFVGPYTFTDPALTAERKTALSDWLIAQRDQHDDEIGLHIHPWCHFVASAGLTCVTDDSTVYLDGDPDGYTIKVSAYSEAEFATLLGHADQLFEARGLGKPVTFRAGGWTASAETLRALAASGYIADTSANNWARMEEWMNQGSGELYRWNMSHWSSIGDTSQPYYPNVDDPLSAAAPTLDLLEVPDNAIMVDYVTVAEMIEIFTANWSGGALTKPTTFMMGFHPAPGFNQGEYARIDGLLDHTDQFQIASDTGPVVYARLRDMPAAFAGR